MSTLATDNQITAEIDDLKNRFSNTQELYREVAALLFFRYGIAPTANKLYQYVRKGSMTAPAEALNRFWEELREKSRVRLQAPDLPEMLSNQAGEMLAALWEQAQMQARDSLATLREDVESQLLALRAERDGALASALTTADALRQLQEVTTSLEGRLVTAEQKIAAELATKAVLEEQLVGAQREAETLQRSLAEARQDFASELEKTRALLHVAEDRAQESTKHHLLEIDRERGLAAKAHQELNTSKASALKQQAHDREALSKLQAQVSELREATGNLQGQLIQLTSQLGDSKLELDAARKALNEAQKLPKPKVRRVPIEKKPTSKSKATKG